MDKKYTLKEWKEFCKDALILPPFDDQDNLNEWFENHKAHIIVNGCDMELEYYADTVEGIEFFLKELYEDIYGEEV